MIFSTTKITKLLFVALVSVLLSACGGGSDISKGEVLLTCDVPMIPDATGTSCVAPPPIACEAPTVPDALNEKCVVGVDANAPVPVFFPAADQAVLYYNRASFGATNTTGDPSYDGYRLHTWNNATCDAYGAPQDNTDWSNGHEYTGIDPAYGAYWVVNLKEDYTDCGNFIIHVGTDDAGKALGNGDFKMPLMQDDETYQRMNFTFHAESSVFEYPIESLGKQAVKITDIAAHWIDVNTFVWDVDPLQINAVKLHYSSTAGIAANEDDQLNGTVIDLIPTSLTDEQKASAPRVADLPAFSGDWSVDDAKAVLKTQLVVAGYNSDNEAVTATYVQADKVLDAVYTRAEQDADEAELGVKYSNEEILVSLWAPTAQSVTLKVYADDKTEIAAHAMTEDSTTGIWAYQGDSSLDRAFYQFEVQVYHYQSKAIETLLVTDPYSVSLSTNGEYSQFVNLADPELMPENWQTHDIVAAGNYEDAVIYEGHIRDFSVLDESTSPANRGKYLAFTEVDTAPVNHLQKLANNGLRYFHLLPSNDIASINEDSETVIDLNHTVAQLCAVNADAPVCGVEDDNATIYSVLESYSPYSNDAANLVDALRGYDSFNWGYDPKHFNVPDGSYASNADGIARITEKRAMIKSLHDLGLRVVMDVVYNHTSSAGLWDNSVFDKVVPGYYHSRDLISGAVIQSTCCNDTALENRMMDKFMVDSLSLWAEHYKVDGFRFDIMSHGSKAQMLAAREAVQTIDEDNHFYGEGWNRDDRGFEQANQFNLAGSEIATYNDRLRDAVRGGQFFSNNSVEDGPFIQQDLIKLGMAGSLADYVLKSYTGVDSMGSAFSPAMYAKDPADVINYVSKHDNETLWDKLQFELSFAMNNEQRVRAQNVSQSIILLSQGIPFLQMGGDFLRSKSLDRNTYDAGDWYNFVDFTKYSNNWNVGLPLDKGGKTDQDLVSLASSQFTSVGLTDMEFASNVFNEFLSIRHGSSLFKLTSTADIIGRVGFHNIGKRQTQGLIVMSIDDGIGLADLDPQHDAIVVVVNGSETELTHTVPTAQGFSLHPSLAMSADTVVSSANFAEGENEGSFTVPALTTAVFVKPQQADEQGIGLSAFATAGAPDVVPYGDTVAYIRGGMNGWGEVDALTYIGDGVYQVAIAMAAGSYEFKVASADWSTINNGAPADDIEVIEGEDKVLVPGSNDNLSLTITTDATYIFSLDASDTNAPILNVRNEEPFVGTTVYIRGGMNGWGEESPLNYLGEGKYSATIAVEEGSHEFKVASADWATVNMGAPADDKEVFIGEEQLLVPGSNDNLMMTFASTGDYTFILDASNTDEPVLTVYSAEMFGATTVFIRGAMNGWGEVDALTYQGNSQYSVDIAIDAGSYEFKVASADWATFNLGASEDNNVGLDSPYLLTQGSNDNLLITIEESATYQFSVQGPNPESPTVTVSKVTQ
jgi:pullulanase